VIQPLLSNSFVNRRRYHRLFSAVINRSAPPALTRYPTAVFALKRSGATSPFNPMLRHITTIRAKGNVASFNLRLNGDPALQLLAIVSRTASLQVAFPSSPSKLHKEKGWRNQLAERPSKNNASTQSVRGIQKSRSSVVALRGHRTLILTHGCPSGKARLALLAGYYQVDHKFAWPSTEMIRSNAASSFCAGG